jgi:hypothetical protein
MENARDEAVRAIEEAFPKAPIEPTNAFTDWGKTYLDVERFEDGVRGRTWDALTPEFLEFHDDALAFLGPDAFAWVLPAYLRALLDSKLSLGSIPFALLPALTRPEAGPDAALWRGRFDARVSRLSPAQREAVLKALAAFIETSGEPRLVQMAREAERSFTAA